jgi:hypothetical protein
LSVQVIDGYIPKEEAKIIIEQFSPSLVSRRFAAAEADFSDNIMDVLRNIYDNMPITSSPELKEGSALITKFVNMIREEINSFYGVDVVSANVNFAELSEGGSNGLHCDSVQLDGSPWDDGNDLLEHLEFSALLYLNSSGEDYYGGEIVFPNQEVRVIPKAGKLVFFRGDIDHPHKVEKIVSGKRYALVLFYGRSDKVSHYLRYKAGEPMGQ